MFKLFKKSNDSGITLIEPNKRFNIIDYPKPWERFYPDDRPKRDPNIQDRIIFSCVNCKKKIEFKDSDFEKHQKNEFSNLNELENKRINKFLIRNKELIRYSSLDFYCPSCRLPVKVLYEGGWGGKMGEYGFRIQKIIEIKDI